MADHQILYISTSKIFCMTHIYEILILFISDIYITDIKKSVKPFCETVPASMLTECLLLLVSL